MTTPDDDNSPAQLAQIAARLDASDDYRVLRRLRLPEAYYNNDNDEPQRTAVFVDCETTGLSFDDDRIIELAMVRFEYGVESGRIFAIAPPFAALEAPGKAIPAEITTLTGIDDAMVAGKTIDDTAVADYMADCALVIAHHAAFDRPMLERRLPVFAEKPWACSQQDIDWRALGYEGVKLEYLALKTGVFFHGHRALNDCQAGIHLLAQPLPADQTHDTIMALLCERARTAGLIVRAVNAPFEKKDSLRDRGYRWHNGADGGVRAWWKEVSEHDFNDELAWLQANVYGAPFTLPPQAVTRVTALDRYKRAG